MNLGLNIVFFISVGIHASAEDLSTCGVPPSYPHAKVADKYSQRYKYSKGEKVVYTCAEGYSASKGYRTIVCGNGFWTRLSLKCEKKSCGSAGELFNGRFDYTGSFSGDKAYAVCNEGFKLKGMEYRTCKDSVWTGEVPTCEEESEPQISPPDITCPYPSVANSVKPREAVSEYRVRDSVTVACSEGFLLTGDKQITCGPDGLWKPQLPQCLPSVREVSCTPPKTQEKLRVISGLQAVYRPRDSLSFSCTSDYLLNGSKTVTCGLNGKWTPPLPKCSLIKCPQIQIQNGKTSTNHRKRGSEVTITCYKGHLLKGVARIVCSTLGKWMGEIPLCVPDPEGRVPQTVPANGSCHAPSVANSVMPREAVSEYRVRDSVTVACSEGFLLTGDKQITCGPDGHWKPQLPQCLSSRNTRLNSTPVGTCGAPLFYPNRHVSHSYLTRTSFSLGDRVRYSCGIGYMKVRGSYYSTCVSGKWTPLTLKCERKLCGSAGEIDFGHFVYTGAEFGDTATGVCNEGYQLIGHNVRNCMNDGWDGRVPVCEPAQCDVPPEVLNGEMNGEAPYTYRTVVSYQCRKGKLFGAIEIYCTKDGTWSAPPPECKDLS